MRVSLVALVAAMLLFPAIVLAAPPAPVQAPTQAPPKAAPAQAPTQAPPKAQANVKVGAETPQVAAAAGYRSYSYQPQAAAASAGTAGYYRSYQRPRSAAGFQPAGYKSMPNWMGP